MHFLRYSEVAVQIFRREEVIVVKNKQIKFDNERNTLQAWKNMGHVEKQCPGCDRRVSYPDNLASYLVVCVCGHTVGPLPGSGCGWKNPDDKTVKEQLYFKWQPRNINNH